MPPRDDINSPDLYIPGSRILLLFSSSPSHVVDVFAAMAIVTYVLICAFHSGVNDRFHPKVLGESATSAMLIVIFDFAFIYLGCYFLNVQGSPGGTAVDLVAYTGYKFVG
jgi:hypothetical protein